MKVYHENYSGHYWPHHEVKVFFNEGPWPIGIQISFSESQMKKAGYYVFIPAGFNMELGPMFDYRVVPFRFDVEKVRRRARDLLNKTEDPERIAYVAAILGASFK